MFTSAAANAPFVARINQAGYHLAAVGRAVTLLGVVLPLLLIGILKFTAIEIEALRPFVENTPWLAWLIPHSDLREPPTSWAWSNWPQRFC